MMDIDDAVHKSASQLPDDFRWDKYVSQCVEKLLSSSDIDSSRRTALEWLNQKLTSLSIFECEDSENSAAIQWLQWASAHQHIHVVTADVPSGILPNGMTGKLYDGKVFCRRGPDDVVYDADAEIRNRVARGNCFLDLSCRGETKTQCLIHALMKFTGGLGDDDDNGTSDEFVWKRYFVKPLEEAKTVVCTPKMNGEAAHLGACKIGNDYYLCAGSKNVHLLFRNHKDLTCYNLKLPRYGIAKEVCCCVLDMVMQLSEVQRNSLLHFLVSCNAMAVFELLSPDHAHIEDLSSLESNKLKFIAWTSCNLQEELSALSLCYLPPDSGIELAKVFGLDTIGYEVVTADQVESKMNAIRLLHGVEGEVLFFLDVDRSTIGLLKKKTVWYIIVRAIREKVRNACGWKASGKVVDVKKVERKIGQRLKEIQKWLQLSDATKQAWEELGIAFLRWTFQKLDDCAFDLSFIQDKYPVCWKQFLDESDRTDKIPSAS